MSKADAVLSENTWKQRMISAGFLTACAVAMIGWMAGLGWAATSAVNLLFF